MKDLIIDFQKSGKWKIQLTIAIKYIYRQEQVMHSKSYIIEVMTYDNANEVIDKIFESFCSRYQVRLETPLKGNDFIFDSAKLLYFKCHISN